MTRFKGFSLNELSALILAADSTILNMRPFTDANGEDVSVKMIGQLSRLSDELHAERYTLMVTAEERPSKG